MLLYHKGSKLGIIEKLPGKFPKHLKIRHSQLDIVQRRARVAQGKKNF